MTKEEILEFIRKNEPHPLHESALSSTLPRFIERERKESFSDMLFRLIREKRINEVELYKAAGLTPQHFSKIRSNSSYQPAKNTVIAIALALHLDLEETKELMRSAGFAFTHSSPKDMVVEYYIINGNHDLMTVNETLDSMGLEII